jgi:hypothetical protein
MRQYCPGLSLLLFHPVEIASVLTGSSVEQQLIQQQGQKDKTYEQYKKLVKQDRYGSGNPLHLYLDERSFFDD